MESPTTTFALQEQPKAGGEQALSRAFERRRRRLVVRIHYKLSRRAREFWEVTRFLLTYLIAPRKNNLAVAAVAHALLRAASSLCALGAAGAGKSADAARRSACATSASQPM